LNELSRLQRYDHLDMSTDIDGSSQGSSHRKNDNDNVCFFSIFFLYFTNDFTKTVLNVFKFNTYPPLYNNLDVSTITTTSISTRPLPSTCPTAAKATTTTMYFFFILFLKLLYSLLFTKATRTGVRTSTTTTPADDEEQ
jgi:hypothetical protein